MTRSATRGIRTYVLTAVLAFTVPVAWGATLTVPGDYATIQAAIDAAVDGDIVEIADGTYTGDGNKNLDFGGKAITVRSASGDPATCIIDCEQDGRGFYFHSGEGPDSTVESLTVMNGTAGVGVGGGVYCGDDSSPTFDNCVFSGNSAGGGGGLGVATGSPVLTGCTFSGNVATSDGGGVWCCFSSPTFVACTFANNSAHEHGGGMKCYYGAPLLIDCTITENVTTWCGGGLVLMYSHPVLTKCTINGNSCGVYGGGVSMTASDSTFISCAISGNSNASRGGGVRCHGRSPKFANCVIQANSAIHSGGAVYCEANSTPQFNNCTITGNEANLEGAVHCDSGEPRLTNCVLWGNAPEEIHVDSGVVIATYCTVQGGWFGEGNIDADPLFAEEPHPGPDGEWGTEDDDYGDLRLQAGSACIDAGTNLHPPRDSGDLDGDGCTTELLPYDCDGNNRYWDDLNTPDAGLGIAPIVDMGAYEFGATTEIPSYPWPGECDCDGVIDFGDIDAFVAALRGEASYLSQYPDCIWLSADCNNDGSVDFDDIDPFVALLGH